MEQTYILNQIKKLNCSNPKKEINKAIKFLVQLYSQRIKMLILPLNNKALWENAALVLKEIGYPRIKPVLDNIMVWLQDLNWPGAKTIIDLLLTVEKSILIEMIENALREAIKENDDMWIAGIRVLVKRKRITSKGFSNNELYELMRSSDTYL